jgi:hypothetical protein
MKKVILLLLLIASLRIEAAPNFIDNFSYSNGNLVGQGSWVQTGTSATTPIQVASGRAVIGTSGQDVNAPLTANISLTSGNSFYYGATINLTAAQSAGDYFLHFTPSSGETSLFFGRVFAKSSGSGFLVGYLETSGGAGAVVNYGTTELSFNTDYRIAVAYNVVGGTLNDTAALYVNPTDSNVGGNTPYLSDSWGSTSAEPSVVGAINLRQGGAANSASVKLDDLIVSTSFADVAAVPEPSTFILGGLGLLSLFALRRRS